MRRVRQDACIDVLSKNQCPLDQAFFDALDSKRLEYDKQFWKVALAQITITGFLGLSLLSIDDVNFSIFGFSGKELSKVREFLLFCHALMIAYAIILQQYIQKLEDFLVAYGRRRFDSINPDNDELKIYLFRYLSPIEAFNVTFLPYRKDLFHNAASKFLIKVHNIFRLLSVLGIVIFTMLVPLFAAISIALSPNFGWLSYCVVGYWAAVAIFSLASALLNQFPLPYTDFSYVMKLADLQNKDPVHHQKLLKEIVATGKLPDIR